MNIDFCITDRREKLEFLIKEYLTLDKKLYIGHDIQTDVFDEKQKILDEVGRIVMPRVDMILDFYKTLPKGEWCKSKHFSDWEAWHKKGCKRIRPYWLYNDMMGFECVTGNDDDYPETTCLGFDINMLLEDSDDEVKRMILQQANEDSSSANQRLDVLLKRESECFKLIEILLRENQRTENNNMEERL